MLTRQLHSLFCRNRRSAKVGQDVWGSPPSVLAGFSYLAVSQSATSSIAFFRQVPPHASQVKLPLMQGETFAAEWRESTDRLTGLTVKQLTHYKGHSHHLYFTNPGWHDGGRRLLF